VVGEPTSTDNLLVAANGGAFAVAKGFAQRKAYELGNLALQQLGIGMTLFTVVMVLDLFMFGQKTRRNHLRGAFPGVEPGLPFLEVHAVVN
jgi:hypothetical protein